MKNAESKNAESKNAESKNAESKNVESKWQTDESRFERVAVVYLIDNTIGGVHVGSQTMSMLVPSLAEQVLEDAFLIAQAKALIAADHDVGEERICIVGVAPLSGVRERDY